MYLWFNIGNTSVEKGSSLPVVPHRISGRAAVKICIFVKQSFSDGFFKSSVVLGEKTMIWIKYEGFLVFAFFFFFNKNIA